MSNLEKLVIALNKAAAYLTEVSNRCQQSKDKEISFEGHSLLGIVNLLEMRIDSIKRSIEHKEYLAASQSRIAELDKALEHNASNRKTLSAMLSESCHGSYNQLPNEKESEWLKRISAQSDALLQELFAELEVKNNKPQ